MKNKILTAMVLVILLITSYNVQALSLEENRKEESSKKFETNIKSANLSTDYNIYQALKDVEWLQLNTVNVPVVIRIDNLSSDTMTVDSESKERAINLIKALKKKNINVILEPYPWIADGSETETKWKPADINSFFWNWKQDVLKPLINDIATPYGVDVINIGSSFVNMEYAEGYWCDTIDFVKSLYNGLVTYRTGWWYTTEVYESKLNNRMFSKLDFISIAAYFELTNKNGNPDENTVEKLVKVIECTESYNRKQNVKKEVKGLSDKWNKKIFFGELGLPKIKNASAEPWNPNPNNTMYNIIDSEEQAKCFEAYKMVFKNEPWFLGFSVFAIGETSYDKYYYPSAQSGKIIRDWYSEVVN